MPPVSCRAKGLLRGCLCLVLDPLFVLDHLCVHSRNIRVRRTHLLTNLNDGPSKTNGAFFICWRIGSYRCVCAASKKHGEMVSYISHGGQSTTTIDNSLVRWQVPHNVQMVMTKNGRTSSTVVARTRSIAAILISSKSHTTHW